MVIYILFIYIVGYIFVINFVIIEEKLNYLHTLAAKYTKVAYFGSLFAMKGLYLKLFSGCSREPGCHPVQVCVTITSILFIYPYKVWPKKNNTIFVTTH